MEEKLVLTHSFVCFSSWLVDFIGFDPVVRQYILAGVTSQLVDVGLYSDNLQTLILA
jgi:hypothetical protein